MDKTNRIRKIVEWSLIPLNSFLLFFLIFEPRIMLPAWLQVFGRMHPLFLHFPIVLVLLYAFITMVAPRSLTKDSTNRVAADTFLLAAAFTASLTALMGFALYRHGSYDSDALAWHKWTGILVPFLLHLLYVIRYRLFSRALFSRIVAISLVIVIALAGHHGAVITHGDNFLLSPITPVEERIIPPFEEAYVYADFVEPILEDKCMSCHNANKSKGDLVMDTRELFAKGGENGVPWDTTSKDLGLMMRMIHLPLEDEEHMPPKGKPQLTEEEIFILHEWISRGADFEKKFTDLLPDDTLYVMGKSRLPSAVDERYDFSMPDDQKIAQLNNQNRVITPIAIGSPALSVTFYNKQFFKVQDISDLAPLSGNIIELNLAGMDVKDEDLSKIAQFPQLRRLNLNYTGVTGKSIGQLQSLAFLRSLSLSGTPLEPFALRELEKFPKLAHVFIWNTPAADPGGEDLNRKSRNIVYYTGQSGDTVVLQLTPPIIENEEVLFTGSLPLKLKHYIRGTEIRYTTDGSIPDSLHSKLYKEGTLLDSNQTITTRAFKKGWIASEVRDKHFFKKSYQPDTVKLLSQPHQGYDEKRGASVNDNIIGDLNMHSGTWLGFQKDDFKALVEFKEPVTARSFTLSMLQDIGAWIFPPVKVQIWAGNSPSSMKLITTFKPEQPVKNVPKIHVPLQIDFSPVNAKYFRIEVVPVRSLPSWHNNKGEKGYFFIDELLVN